MIGGAARPGLKSSPMTQHTPTAIPIAIIGTGFAGLAMAIRLKENGIEDFTLFERADELGGTWRDNSYPGCACDVESHLYSFSFAPNPAWSRMFSAQPEIWAYLKAVADRFGLRPHIRFGHEMKGLTWDAERSRWNLATSKGDFTADIVVSAVGALSEPAVPRLAGIDTFEGKVMHSARWDHAYPLDGKRVAVVGTGASAIQFVPEIQPRVEKLVLFQRTPPWIVPRLDRRLKSWELALLARFPFLQKLWRLRIYLFREFLGLAFRRPKMMEKLKAIALRHMKRAIPDDAALRARLTPEYTIGCKRILISNNYYPALTRENVEVVTEGIREVRARSIVTADGKEREIDAIVFGTGFQVTDMPWGKYVRGKGGRLLDDTWKGSPHAFLGTTVPGFPNLFAILGPNTGLGHNSVVLMIESQVAHILKAIRYMRKKKARSLEAKEEAEARFLAEVEKRMHGTVWTSGGCKSWYLDRTGKNSTLWPGSVGSFRRRVRPFRPGDYHV